MVTYKGGEGSMFRIDSNWEEEEGETRFCEEDSRDPPHPPELLNVLFYGTAHPNACECLSF